MRNWEYEKLQMIGYMNRFKAMQKICGLRIPICEECGESDFRVLTINHIRGLKKNECKKRRHLHRFINKGLRKTKDLNILCHNCNWIHEFRRRNLFLDKKHFEKLLKEKGIIRMSDKIK